MIMIFRKKGFTLVEVVVVLGLLFILATITIVAIGDSRRSTFNTARKADIQAIQLALEEYRGACGGQYPDALSLSASNGCPDGTTFQYFLDPIPVDPENASSYGYVGLRTAASSGGTNGVCYDYHIWAVLTDPIGDLLDEDHDADASTNTCNGGTDLDGDDSAKRYDFRSRNSG
jgi:type II secretory pathway pseudopilin PulG